MAEKDGINTKDFLIGGLIGAIVGSAAALLFAPKSGKELREDLNTQVDTIKEKATNGKMLLMKKVSKLVV